MKFTRMQPLIEIKNKAIIKAIVKEYKAVLGMFGVLVFGGWGYRACREN